MNEAEVVTVAFLIGLSLGLAGGYVSGFVDGWAGHKVLSLIRRFARRRKT